MEKRLVDNTKLGWIGRASERGEQSTARRWVRGEDVSGSRFARWRSLRPFPPGLMNTDAHLLIRVIDFYKVRGGVNQAIWAMDWAWSPSISQPAHGSGDYGRLSAAGRDCLESEK